jgi:UDP-N-acetylglucosamine--N-acetylmuramyl-(pentapeptide) pyrophosphoryl-undecaprenol N-acetylglucosamine transferase
VLTGGGTAGHVTPNMAIIPKLRAAGWQIHYIGTKDGIERSLLEKFSDVQYHYVSCGKFRRYFSIKNFTDPFRVIKGVFQARKIIKNVNPSVMFSKGGFVSVPVAIGCRMRGVPVVLHESDYTPGLANKLVAPYASKICVTFDETLSHIKKSKGIYTGTPIRDELLHGSREKGLELCGFDGSKPVVLVMGGSSGALALNEALKAALDLVLARFDVVHLCGAGKTDPSMNRKGYKSFEYLTAELADVFAACDVVVSRAGANAVFEFLALHKPALLIPLPLSSSRGDQLLNAEYFRKRDFAAVLIQEDITPELFNEKLCALYDERDKYIAAMKATPQSNGTQAVLNVIFSVVEQS